MKIFYFTSTGNCLEVAKALGGELLSIPKVLREGITSFEAEAIGIVCPCYALGIPPIVEEFFQKVELKSDYLFGIMTYGNFDAAGVEHLNKVAQKNRVKLSYTNSLLMVANYLNFFKMEKQIEKIPSKKITENLTAIVKDIHERKKYIKNVGLFKKALTSVAQTLSPIKSGNYDKSFIIEDNCNGCKVCEKVCPVNNIKVNVKPEFKQQCISCYACTHNCPQNAIRLKGERSKVRFRNQNVELSEIIDSNS